MRTLWSITVLVMVAAVGLVHAAERLKDDARVQRIEERMARFNEPTREPTGETQVAVQDECTGECTSTETSVKPEPQSEVRFRESRSSKY